jgi:hypothetical protein
MTTNKPVNTGLPTSEADVECPISDFLEGKLSSSYRYIELRSSIGTPVFFKAVSNVALL